jgi:uncharacterized protein (TIGR00369 family)
MDISKAIEKGFQDAPFVARLGVELLGLGDGWCEAGLVLQPWHLQQNGFVHAGDIATLADHASGAAATTAVKEGEFVLTAEYKINLLRPARGKRLWCRAEVLKPGRMLAVVEAQVYAGEEEKRDLVAKLNATMAVVRPG